MKGVGDNILEHKDMFVQLKFAGANATIERIVNNLCRLFKDGRTNSHFEERNVRSSVVMMK